MDLSEIYEKAIRPAYTELPAVMRSREATALLLAIGLQESAFKHRRQIGGPARGFWQFEKGGGVYGVLNHHMTRTLAADICIKRGIRSDSTSVYSKLDQDDILAAAFSRLLLWTDPWSLPELGDAQAAWDLYIRTWRPGKPHRHTWDALYQQALKAAADYE